MSISTQTPTPVNYISISTNGYTTSIVRNLGLRIRPLPFDWVNTNIESISQCFKDDFKKFNKNLNVIDNDNNHVIDEYGFVFKYDYPLYTNKNILDYSQQFLDSFIQNNKINDIVTEKYISRINHFHEIMNSTDPIICLCNYSIKDVIKLQELFITYYNRTPENLYIINISLSPLYDSLYIPLNIYNVNLNTRNIYIWKYMIDLVLRHYKNTYEAHNKPQLPLTNEIIL